MAKIRTGIQILIDSKLASISGKKIAVVANQATVDHNLNHLVDILAASTKTQLVRILAPEHGFRGAAQDMEHVTESGDTGSRDPRTKIPVFSLYGDKPESLVPAKELLQDLDCLVVDLPDIGSRYYTFAQTMIYCMKVAAEVGVKVIVLDRPNPINGSEVEGVGLDPSCRSFCGHLPVAQRHGLTLGEHALLANSGFGEGNQNVSGIGCELEVIRCEGWKRTMYYDQTDLIWVQPSVNMPTLETAIVYPGACLFEATNISEGRGTTKPFELLGAPYIDGYRWAEATFAQGLDLRGAILRPVEFRPKFQKHSNITCGGVQIHVTDRDLFKPLRWSLALIAAAKREFPESFAWRGEAYEFISSVNAIDLLYGSSRFRNLVENNQSLEPLEAEISTFSESVSKQQAGCLLY